MPLRLDELVGALAGAVVEAQHQVNQVRLGDLWAYFREGAPVSAELKIPRFNPTTATWKPETISVPLITMVNQSSLSIRQMQLTMQVDLTEIAKGAREKAAPAYEWKPAEYRPLLAASTTTGKQPGAIGIAQLTLTVAAEEPPEGLARLLSHLTKVI